eukprot:TRINITY_DN2490_c0_g1_i4.p1 TRINITY_DN2490_c0_g1~~TRINITY_DN2490_c0_g1_i4.p1  ORF type:complete len:944 (+),score=141.90 TRINITY_DN2490_c0_g1_i4:51-2882(+)
MSNSPPSSPANPADNQFSELVDLLNGLQTDHIHRNKLVEFLRSASLHRQKNAIIVPTELADTNYLKRGWSWIEGTVLANKDRDLPKLVGYLLQSVGKANWVLSGFFLVGIALERWVTNKSNRAKCVKLLYMMNTTVLTLHQLEPHFGGHSKVIQQAMQIVIENTILCCDYLGGKGFRKKLERIWKAKTMEELVSESQRDLDAILTNVNCESNLTMLNLIMDLLQSIKNISEEFNYYAPPPQKLLSFIPVGIDDQVKEVGSLLNVDGVNEKAVGVIIWGLGGFGKSTLAKDFIHSLHPLPANYKFAEVELDNTIKEGRPGEIAKLQQEIVNKLTGIHVKIGNPNDGKIKLGEVLEKTSSFLFIDNVDTIADIQMLLPQHLSLKDGIMLRILITSRDRQLKEYLPGGCTVKEHPMRHLSSENGLAFLQKLLMEPEHEFQDKFPSETQKLKRIVALCHGIPLLLKIAGEQLREEREIGFYKKLIRKLEKGDLLKEEEHYHEKIIDLLLFVFNRINTDLKYAFLDLCIYFHDRPSWWCALPDCFSSRIWSDVFGSEMSKLVKRGLLNIQDCRTNIVHECRGRVTVHDILKELAAKEARKCYILNKKEWKEASNHSTEEWREVKGIRLGSYYKRNHAEVITVESETVDATHASLRLLRLHGNEARIQGKCRNSFEELRYFELINEKPQGFPFECVSTFTNLQYVLLAGFDDLPTELFSLPRLSNLNLADCKGLEQLPDEIAELEELKELRIVACPITNLPESFSRLTSLKHCELSYTPLEKLPDGFCECLAALEALRLRNKKQLRHLPESFGELRGLQHLKISDCPLERLPKSFSNLTSLKHLYIGRLPVTEISCEGLKQLKYLSLDSCKYLKNLGGDLRDVCEISKDNCPGLEEGLADRVGQLENEEYVEILRRPYMKLLRAVLPPSSTKISILTDQCHPILQSVLF